MTMAEIIQIIIGILSLLATISIPIMIHRSDIKRIEEDAKKQLERDAEMFIRINYEEIEYLPLCIFANAVGPYTQNSRKIYNNFNACPKEIQFEILKKRNIPFGLIKNKNVFDEYISSFQKQSLKYKLWDRTWLYDNAKYFHRSIQLYRNIKLDTMNPHVFTPIHLNKAIQSIAPNFKESLTTYTSEFLEISLKGDTQINLAESSFVSPFNAINQLFYIENSERCGEDTTCLWIMRFIFSSCIAFWRNNLVENSNDDWRQLNVSDDMIQTYEDMYYDTLLTLFTTYGNLNDTYMSNHVKETNKKKN